MGFRSKICIVSIKKSFRAIHYLQSREKLCFLLPSLILRLYPGYRLDQTLTQGCTSFVDHLYFLFLVFLMLSRLSIAALWSPVGKGLLFVMFIVFLLLSDPGSGVVLDCSVS